MIGITKLLFPEVENFGDKLRYSHGTIGVQHGAAHGMGPVTIWHATRTCNLKCAHCYASSEAKKYQGELTTEEARAFIDDLSDFRVPALLLSGGEPLAREDILDLATYANSKGVRTTFSTNGTLIDAAVARKMKEIGVGYVGISLDGLESEHDQFRGVKGAFNSSIRAFRHLREVGQRSGLRFVINKGNFHKLKDVMRLIEEEGIQRVCFYHMVYSGRGGVDLDVTHEQSRQAMDLIIEQVEDWHARGVNVEVLTVDNHADVVYLYLYMLKRDPERAARMYEMMQSNRGNRVGIAIGDVDNLGYVHCDQFTQHHSFGNVREKKFSQIWTEAEHPLLAGLKNRQPLLKGRCASCKWLNVCNGNFRTRAEAVTGDFWESDPACYLTDEEIGLSHAAD